MNDNARSQFEQCKTRPSDANRMAGGEQAYRVKSQLEVELGKTTDDFCGLGKWDTMLLVLRAKYEDPDLKKYLCDSAGMFLVEHCEVAGRDLYWTDDYDGGGQNRLGAALMLVRDELLAEAHRATGWPTGVDLPPWLSDDSSNWQSWVDVVAQDLSAQTLKPPLTAH